MKRKLTFTLLVLMFTLGSAYAQFGGCKGYSGDIADFKGTTTQVVLTGDELFDEQYKLGFEKHWKVTEYEFIEDSEVRERISNPKYSFIMLMDVNITENGVTQTYPQLVVINGGKKRMKDYDYYDLIARTVIDHFGIEKDIYAATYRAQHMVKMTQDYLNAKLTGELSDACVGIRTNVLAFQNKRNKEIKNKTLLIDQAHLGKIDEDDIKKYYNGKIRIVSRLDIEDAIIEAEEDYCYLLPIYTRHKYVMVVDAATGEIMYDAYSKYGLKLKKGDFKALGEAL